jgi:hypothetical protein
VWNLKEKDQFEDLGIYTRIILKGILGNQDMRAWTRLTWPTTEISGDLLSIRY